MAAGSVRAPLNAAARAAPDDPTVSESFAYARTNGWVRGSYL